jgi:hypothetical protein
LKPFYPSSTAAYQQRSPVGWMAKIKLQRLIYPALSATITAF